MVADDFNHIIDAWIQALEQYDFNELCLKPSADSWSLGQLYKHLIIDTDFYIEQIKCCVTTDDHAGEEALPAAKTMFLTNSFPDEILEGAPANATIPQPRTKQELMSGLLDIKDKINKVALLISGSSFKGKTKHPGLGYFNAEEWLQFSEMHFRHHLRQKKRIDIFLKTNNS